MNQLEQPQHPQHPQQINQSRNHPVNIYSPHYATYMGIKPKATTSAKLNMTSLMRSMRKR
jgi:hypothetical protein